MVDAWVDQRLNADIAPTRLGNKQSVERFNGQSIASAELAFALLHPPTGTAQNFVAVLLIPPLATLSIQIRILCVPLPRTLPLAWATP
jgi:hypothetical protein